MTDKIENQNSVNLRVNVGIDPKLGEFKQDSIHLKTTQLDSNVAKMAPGSKNYGVFNQLFENQLINYEQAAQYLSVSVPYLRKLKRKGKIPFVPMGSRGVRFRVKSLSEWAEKREIK